MLSGRKGLWHMGWSLQRATHMQPPTSVSGHLVLFRPRIVSHRLIQHVKNAVAADVYAALPLSVPLAPYPSQFTDLLSTAFFVAPSRSSIADCGVPVLSHCAGLVES